MIVKAWLLIEPLRHEPGFVASHSAIRVSFDPENPFTSNNIRSTSKRDQGPSSILIKALYSSTTTECQLGSRVAWARVVGSVMSLLSWVVKVSFWMG